MEGMKTTAAQIMRNPSAYGVGRFSTFAAAQSWIAMLGGVGRMQVLMGDVGTYLTAEGRVLGALKRAGYERA